MEHLYCGGCYDALLNLDTRLLFDVNSLVPNNDLGEIVFRSFNNNPHLRGFLILFPLIILWFSSDSVERRSRMLAGLLATVVATALSVWLQHRLTFHIRPFLDPTLHLERVDIGRTKDWDRLGSFPSDTGTLFFSLATIVFLENRLAGGIAFLWSLITVGVLRVALGWHYPSDIVGALILAPALVYLFTRIRYLGTFFERVLRFFEPRIYVLHALLFIFLADAYFQFAGLEGFVRGLGAARKHLMG